MYKNVRVYGCHSSSVELSQFQNNDEKSATVAAENSSNPKIIKKLALNYHVKRIPKDILIIKFAICRLLVLPAKRHRSDLLESTCHQGRGR